MDPLETIARVPRRPPRVDLAITALLLVWAVIEALAASGPGLLWQRVAFAVGVTLPLVLRRRAPVTVMAVLIGVLMVRIALVPGQEDSTFPFPSLLVATFSVALHTRGRAVAVATGFAPVLTMLALFPLGYYQGPMSIGQTFILGFFVAGAWVAGWLVRLRADRAAAAPADSARLAEEAAAARSDSARLAEEAVAAERAPIARELHDVVAHSLSIVAVQAGAAEELTALDPGSARAHIAAARRTAREALTEMRHVLDVQREGGPEAAPALAPQPTLERVADLVDEVFAAGLPVRLVTDGERGTVPAGVDLAGFRIVQEALTNVRRHAGAAETRVRIGYGDRWIEVEIRNAAGAPGTRAAARTAGAGRGLVGMRERVRLYGGTVTAGPDGDGFAVHARLPREPQ
ncbi:sensor histidine kinase [Dactylosporangium fulvum]|uniref:sensor histidine kinase n=1 Tax=Dactylosporangium fulvum TaxID=53359 RepID=UPI0031E3C9AD